MTNASILAQMYQQMVEEENKKANPAAVQVATPAEKKISVQRGFAAKTH